MNIDFKKHILPHLIAIILFLIITVGFFSPVFFENKDIIQGDIQQWKGGARELIDYRDQTGEEGLWTNSMFSGMPGYLVNVEWSDKPVEYLHRLYTLGLPHPVRIIFAAFLSFNILLLSFGVRPFVSIAIAVAFGLSSFMIIGLAAGHNSRIGSIAYMPLLLAGIHLTITQYRWLGFGVTTAALALHLRLNHLQITYYALLIVLIYGVIMLYYSWKDGSLKPFIANSGLLVIAALIAIGSVFGELWSTFEYGKFSMRGKSELASDIIAGENEDGLKKDYAFQYSNGIFEPLFLVIPNFMGGSSGNLLVLDPDSKSRQALQRSGDQQTANQLARFSSAYWGKQPYTAPYYGGAIIGFLFIVGILFAEKKLKIWLLIVFSLGIILSWGSNFQLFNYMMFDHFPGYNKFRSVTFAIVLSIFSVGLLAGLGLEKFLQTDFKKPSQKKLMIATGIFTGICLILILIAGIINMGAPVDSQLPAWYSRALQADRAALLRSDAFRSMILVAITFGLLWLGRQGKINTTLGSIALLLLIAFDMWNVSSRYFTTDNYQRNTDRTFFAENDADVLINQDNALSYRVYNFQNWTEARTSYHHKSIGGYHGAKIRRYQDLYDNILQNQTEELITQLRSGGDFSGLSALNMLNTRYFYAGNSREMVFRNPYALGNAWLISKIEFVNSPDEELEVLNNINPATTATVDISDFKVSAKKFSDEGTVDLTSYAPDRLSYTFNGAGPSLVVFSEIYYSKGWVATIDDQHADIIRVNYILRALEVPAGNHTIEFRFIPKAYFTGNKITAVFSILVILTLIGSIFVTLRQSPTTSER